MTTLEKKPTQCQRILEVLEKGEWVNGRVFIQQMMISQAHARIKELQEKGYEIIPSDDTDLYGFKSYKLIPKETLW